MTGDFSGDPAAGGIIAPSGVPTSACAGDAPSPIRAPLFRRITDPSSVGTTYDLGPLSLCPIT